MRTKNVATGITAHNDAVEGPEGLENFLTRIAEQIREYEVEHNVSFSVNTVVRTTEAGGEHYLPFAYARSTKELCATIRNGGFCAHHSVEDMPDFVNTQDVCGYVNAYQPYDAEHLDLVFGINSGLIGQPSETELFIDEFKIVFGEIMVQGKPLPEDSVLNSEAGQVKFWGGRLQTTLRRLKAQLENAPDKIDALAQLLDMPKDSRAADQALRVLGMKEYTPGKTKVEIPGDKDPKLVAALDEVLQNISKGNFESTPGAHIIDFDDPDLMAHTPDDLKETVEQLRAQGHTGKLVHLNLNALRKQAADSISDSEPAVEQPSQDHAKLMAATPANKTVH